MSETAKTPLSPGSDAVRYTFTPDYTISSGANLPGSSLSNAAQARPEGKDTVSPAIGEDASEAARRLARPELPALSRENLARLLMQTPTRLFLYWTTLANPRAKLERALGGKTSDYALVLKLVDLKHRSETLQFIEAEGEWWFDVDADGEYMAEIGFYSPSRPWVRILYSNAVQTPRKSPSPHSADDVMWQVGFDRFAKVLDVSGYKKDAFDVVLAGEAPAESSELARDVFSAFAGVDRATANELAADEIRYALLALAAGVVLDELRHRIGARLFALLAANADRLTSEKALAAVRDNFGIDAELVEDEPLSVIFGSSMVNFPRTFKRRLNARAETVSSDALL